MADFGEYRVSAFSWQWRRAAPPARPAPADQ